MFGLFKRTRVVEHITNADVLKQVLELREQLEWVKAQHLSLRGRVYALWGKEEPEKPQGPLDLQDPRLTKPQLRAALAARGALKPRTEN